MKKLSIITILAFMLAIVGLYATPLEDNTKACDAGNTSVCTNLGVKYFKGQGMKQDYFKAKILFGKACDGGNADGCTNLGVMYANGLGVKQDYSKAVKLYSKACDGGKIDECHRLAKMYLHGLGVKKDHSEAAKFYAKVCDSGNVNGCYQAGLMYVNNYNGARRPQPLKALKFLGKACVGGVGAACYERGWINQVGLYGRKNFDAAEGFYEMACDMGHAPGCSGYSALQQLRKIR